MGNFKDKGNVGESAFLHLMNRLDVETSIPFGDNLPYDVVIRVNGKFYAVQVKTGNYDEESNSYQCMLCTCYYDSKTKKYLRHFYEENEVDLFAFYCIEKDVMCLVPSKFIKNNNVITISLNSKDESRQITNRWFYEDNICLDVINKLKNNEEIENPIILNESLSKYKTKYNDVPEYILKQNNSRLIEAYKRAIKSESGFRGVTLNDNKNDGFKYKCYFRQDDVKVYLGRGNDAKELAEKHDQKAIEIFGNEAITNKKLGLL